MNNALQIFDHSEFGGIRTVVVGGKQLFVAVDVARALDYAKPADAVRMHCKGDSLSYGVIDGLGREQETRIITEGDVYRLIIKAADQSRNLEIKAKAARFERWIFDEVLPSIRRHGLFAKDELLDNPDLLIDVLQQLKAERQVNKALTEENETLEIALNDSLRYYTVARYNIEYGKGWKLKETQQIGKRMTAFCRANSIQIRKCKTNDERFSETNSYPLTAWESFFGRGG